MKTAAMIFAVLAFGGAAICWLMSNSLTAKAYRARGDDRPAWKAWTWNWPLEVSNFDGHAADLAAASNKAGIAGYVCFLAALFALAIGKDDPQLWNFAVGGLLFSPLVLGVFALCLLRSPKRTAGH